MKMNGIDVLDVLDVLDVDGQVSSSHSLSEVI